MHERAPGRSRSPSNDPSTVVRLGYRTARQAMTTSTWHITGRGEREWRIEERGELLNRFDYRDDAIREAARRGRAREADGERTHLVIHRLDGSIERELHFGRPAFRPR
ncbi:hypothetical protein [Dokdonella sp.]|uniref:hypothetical protein n=1 Tax=Dokdonella sp. TaxID=2291710 RepID=UPI002F3E413D